MNIETLKFQLGESLEHLNKLATDVREGRIRPDDEPALGIQLDHVMSHLCLLWNGRDLTINQIGDLPQKKFERLANTIPNFFGTKEIGEIALD